MSQSTTTLEPSTDEIGQLTLFTEDSRARMLALRASVLVLSMLTGKPPEAAFGERCAESLARLGPGGVWLKTSEGCCQYLLPMEGMAGDLEPFCETWPDLGIVLDGHATALTMPERLTGETGCLSSESGQMWPTPSTRDFKGANGDSHFSSRARPHMSQLPNAVKVAEASGPRRTETVQTAPAHTATED